ncbi:MAG: hypothetical protein KJ749_00920 [Planctomycetes bacterium]|nr:hypothetical protein [Planctomycetota bacterium]
MAKLPFDRGVFWKVFITVMVLLVLTFWILFHFTSYKLTSADTYGSLISATILSYLLHLWLLPMDRLYEEDWEDEEENPAYDGDSDEVNESRDEN